jgi:hypothetical protein
MIFELKQIDFCDIAKNTIELKKNAHGLNDYLDWFNDTIGGTWLPCPWKVCELFRKYKIEIDDSLFGGFYAEISGEECYLC